MDVKSEDLIWDEQPDCIEYEKNMETLEKRISELKLEKGSVVVAFDFDDLVIESNLTKKVTGAIAKKPAVAKTKKLHIMEALAKFQKRTEPKPANRVEYTVFLANGVNWEDYKRISNEKAGETRWRDGFKELVQDLNEKHNVIFINSGPKQVVYSKLKEISFDPSNIIGDEYKIENGKITGANLVVLSRFKGRVVASLRNKYKVIGVGHDIDDLFMLHNSELSIAYNPENFTGSFNGRRRLANYYAKSVDEIRDIIKKNSG